MFVFPGAVMGAPEMLKLFPMIDYDSIMKMNAREMLRMGWSVFYAQEQKMRKKRIWGLTQQG